MPVCAEKQASEGRAIKPAPQRVAGFPPCPFLSGGGGGGSAFINAQPQPTGFTRRLHNQLFQHLPPCSLCSSADTLTSLSILLSKVRYSFPWFSLLSLLSFSGF
jgi:hypothetical protein